MQSGTRIVNKYKDTYDEYIGRGSLWGNPWTHIKDKSTKAIYIVESREKSIEKFKEYFLARIEEDEWFRNETLKLKGKTLGCFCKPQSCHGDIIKEWLDKQE